MLAWDTETGLIQGGLLAPPLACVSFTEDETVEADLVHVKDPACKRIVRDILEREHIGANTPYDLGVVGAEYPDYLPLIFEALDANTSHDVIVREKLFDIGDGNYRIREVDEGGDQPVFVSVRYGLSDLHERYCGTKLEKDEFRLWYGKLRHVPMDLWPEGARKYPKLDATATIKVCNRQLQEPRRTETERYLVNETAQCRAGFAFHLIACWGIKTDAREVQRFLREIADEQNKRRAMLQRAGLVSDVGSRTKKIALGMMREALGDGCVLTKTGLDQYRAWWAAMRLAKQPITDELKLREKRRLLDQGYVSLAGDVCLQTGNKLLIEYARYGQFQTLFTKTEKLQTNGLPIQTSFETLLETGRASSYASKIIPNSAAIMNLPRAVGMRECFIPRDCEMERPIEERRVFIAADYRMAELVSLAQVCYALFGHSELRNALNRGIDPHLDFAAMLLGITYEEALANKDHPTVKEFRQMAKAFNFGRPGGLGDETFMSLAQAVYKVSFGNTLEESRDMVRTYTRKYFQKWPEVRRYLDFIGGLCEAGEKGLCSIKQYVSERLRGKLMYTVAANTLFQGLTADAFKAAAWEVQKRCYVGMRVPEAQFHQGQHESLFLFRQEPIRLHRASVYLQTHLHGSRVVAPVHDELVLEAGELYGHEIALELQHVMEREYQRYTPDVLITTEASMMRRWSKNAKPAFHNGRLIPWEDKRLYQQEAA